MFWTLWTLLLYRSLWYLFLEFSIPIFSNPLQVRWGDDYGGYGEHYYEYNHGPTYEKKEPSYAPPPQTCLLYTSDAADE